MGTCSTSSSGLDDEPAVGFDFVSGRGAVSRLGACSELGAGLGIGAEWEPEAELAVAAGSGFEAWLELEAEVGFGEVREEKGATSLGSCNDADGVAMDAEEAARAGAEERGDAVTDDGSGRTTEA